MAFSFLWNNIRLIQEGYILSWNYSPYLVMDLLLLGILIPIVEEVIYRGHISYRSLFFGKVQVLLSIGYIYIIGSRYITARSTLLTIYESIAIIDSIILASSVGTILYVFWHYWYFQKKGQRLAPTLSIVLPSIFFILIHAGFWIATYPSSYITSIVLMAGTLSLVTLRWGLVESIVIHVLINSSTVFLVLYSGGYTL